jgi:hypothetical protein
MNSHRDCLFSTSCKNCNYRKEMKSEISDEELKSKCVKFIKIWSYNNNRIHYLNNLELK